MKGTSVIHLHKKGFTLVELIVVIAIVAILAAVSIVGFSQYIDRGRFSNDTQVAMNMTRILNSDQVGLSDELNALQVKTILEGYMPDVSFTPEARDTGFFYLQSSQRVVAAKYADAGDLDVELEARRTVLLSDAPFQLGGVGPGDTPEELFGEGLHLMTTEGSIVAEVVHALSSLIPFSNDIATDFAKLEKDLSDRGWVLGWLSSYDPEPLLASLLNTFDPATTLYVNNSNWVTEANNGGAIERIVFASGITNIPTYDLGMVTLLEEISLPGTVKTIESGGLSAALSDDLTTIHVSSGSAIKVFAGAFAEGLVSVAVETITNQDLVDYSTDIKITRHDGKVQYDLTDLPIRADVVGYNVVIRGNVYEISIYTSEGLVGFARTSPKAYVITYFANNETAYEYFATETVYDNSLVLLGGDDLPDAPSGKSFSGWFTAGGVQIVNGATIEENITLYAQWS